MSTAGGYPAPSDCPVCGTGLEVTRLGCASCGTELVGEFRRCEFCALDADDLATVRVFLASRGNVRELEKHLKVSYPTARQRLTRVLGKLGLNTDEAPSREQILTDVAEGRLTPAEAQELLERGTD